MTDYVTVLENVAPEQLDQELREAFGDNYRGVSTAPRGGYTESVTTGGGEPDRSFQEVYDPASGEFVMLLTYHPPAPKVERREGETGTTITVHLADGADHDLAAMICHNHKPAPPQKTPLQALGLDQFSTLEELAAALARLAEQKGKQS